MRKSVYVLLLRSLHCRHQRSNPVLLGCTKYIYSTFNIKGAVDIFRSSEPSMSEMRCETVCSEFPLGNPFSLSITPQWWKNTGREGAERGTLQSYREQL